MPIQIGRNFIHARIRINQTRCTHTRTHDQPRIDTAFGDHSADGSFDFIQNLIR